MIKIRFFALFIVSFLTITNLYANADIGAKLFQGTIQFKNGGVACIACHTVNSNLVSSGGKLSINLTAMGGDVIKYTIEDPKNASSKIMQVAFENKPLTKSEQSDLYDFFNRVAKDNLETQSSSFFVLKGLIGVGLLFLILSFLGKKGKQQSVNQELYDRQIKTSWKENK